METNYLRIGTTYYKSVYKPLASGDEIESLVTWSVECIKQDHGKDYLSSIPRYDGFCLVPSHMDYKRRVGNFYNRYHPFGFEPAELSLISARYFSAMLKWVTR